MSNNVQIVSDSYLCSNCGACYAVCPQNAIEFKSTSMGRVYPKVDAKCVECGICKKVCPSIDSLELHNRYPDKYVGTIINTYIGRSTNNTLFENAQSGGAVSAVLTYLFKSKKIDAALVCKMSLGNPPSVEAVCITDEKELEQCQKSCYTPVPLLSALRLSDNKQSIAVVGLPCHIEALTMIVEQIHGFQGVKYKLGLVCDRTLSGTIQNVVLSYINNKPAVIHWRDKNGLSEEDKNYKKAQIIVVDKDGEKHLLPRYYRTRLKDFFTAPRCLVCSDKINIHADVVFGDPWGVEGVDWKNGDSLIITRTEIGNQLIAQAAYEGVLTIKETPMRPALRGQHINERRISVSAAVAALETVVNCEESYLTKQKDSDFVTSDDIENMSLMIKSYISREKKSIEEVVDEAKGVLNTTHPPKRQSLKDKILNRFCNKSKQNCYRVLLSGVETENKGAELMLYAILQELERKHPDAEVFIDKLCVKQGLKYVKSPINLKFIKMDFLARFCNKYHITGMLRRMGIYLWGLDPISSIGRIDMYLDGSGLLFSDQRRHSKMTNKLLASRLKHLNKQQTKIVYLPQAFGPLNKQSTRDAISVIDRYSNLIFAREQVSFNYLEPCIKNKQKIIISTDFTSLVKGIMPSQYEHLRNGVCIIPNERMVSKGIVSRESYLDFLSSIVEVCREYGKKVYLLNHEGKRDELLAIDCKQSISDDLEVVTGLNALETKGLISSAYMVISSRFHGVASSLNSFVPCLSTSWNHKYAELYKDYGLTDFVLPIDDLNRSIDMIKEVMNQENNDSIRTKLKIASPNIKSKTQEMWKKIWSLDSQAL